MWLFVERVWFYSILFQYPGKSKHSSWVTQLPTLSINHLSIHSINHPSIHHPPIHSLPIYSFIHSPIHSPIHPFTTHPFIHQSIHSPIIHIVIPWHSECLHEQFQHCIQKHAKPGMTRLLKIDHTCLSFKEIIVMILKY